jgi:hypothetical protein
VSSEDKSNLKSWLCLRQFSGAIGYPHVVNPGGATYVCVCDLPIKNVFPIIGDTPT